MLVRARRAMGRTLLVALPLAALLVLTGACSTTLQDVSPDASQDASPDAAEKCCPLSPSPTRCSSVKMGGSRTKDGSCAVYSDEVPPLWLSRNEDGCPQYTYDSRPGASRVDYIDDCPNLPPKSDSGSNDSGSACNALTIGSTPVGVVRATTEASPAPIGGVIEDGTYVFSEYVTYGKMNAVPAAPFLRSKLVVKGATWEQVNAGPSAGATERTESLTSAVAGTRLTLTKTCAPQAPQSFEYSVTSTGFAYYVGTAEVSAMIYVKQ